MAQQPDDPGRGARVGHTDRDSATQRLIAACSEGRITLGEFEERVEVVLAATTWNDLHDATRDLPVPVRTSPVPANRPRDTRWSVSLIGALHRQGPSHLPRHLIHVSLIGGATIDLGDAELSGAETTITLVSLIGRANIRVPSAVRTELSGFTFIGGRHVTGTRAAIEGGPFVHVRAFSLIGGATVRPSGSRWRRFALAR